jgi:hypothetical protein
LVGGIKNLIGVNQIVSSPENIISSSFYGYDNGYKVVDVLSPWKAYWIKVNGPGQLILTGSAK